MVRENSLSFLAQAGAYILAGSILALSAIIIYQLKFNLHDNL